MNINDYLISQTRTDWGRLLKDWVPPLPRNFTLWLVNCLGDVFVVRENGAVHWLEVGSGRFVEAARSSAEFARLLDTGDNANLWLRISLVDACRRAGMRLAPHECYGFKIPPALGGRYEVANLQPTHLVTHYSYQAYICKQTDVYWVPPG
jgi:hypothetical protein